jgi:thiosulfate reductase/polysulfide reductase chain A
MAEEVKRAICEFCHNKCRVLAYVEDGNITKFEQDPTDPRGSALPSVEGCLRVRGAREWMYHSDRLNFPLKRVAERGDGKWQQISWEQCLDEIADKLRQAICRVDSTISSAVQTMAAALGYAIHLISW